MPSGASRRLGPIGEINDLVIDKQKVVYAIIVVGGFPGMDEKLSAVPYDNPTLNDTSAASLQRRSTYGLMTRLFKTLSISCSVTNLELASSVIGTG